LKKCPKTFDGQPLKEITQEEDTIPYTYSVYWREDVTRLSAAAHLLDEYNVEQPVGFVLCQ
jgi:hypothetical protein